MSEDNFSNPEKFYPERFIDATTGEVIRDEKVILFGVGKRRCPGELLAKAKLLPFLASMVQRFRFEADGPIDFTPVPGIIFCPTPYSVLISPRDQATDGA